LLFVSVADGSINNVNLDGLGEAYPNYATTYPGSPGGIATLQPFFAIDYAPSGFIVDDRYSSAQHADVYVANPFYFPEAVNPACGTGTINNRPGFDLGSRNVGGGCLSGVGSLEPGTTQWTTPDAYPGENADPMSQRAYMWDRNNPYVYSDPTGYCATPIGFIGCVTAVGPWAIPAAPDVAPMAMGAARMLGPIGTGLSLVLTASPAGEPANWQATLKRKGEKQGKSSGAKEDSKQRPDDAPNGTKPIDKAGLTREEIHKIKRGINAGAADWVGVDQDGDVWINSGGQGENLGHYTYFLH
jgi:hypothetical protein